MKDKIKVEVLITTPGLGKIGDIKEVSFAYANNLLFPKKIARTYVEKVENEKTPSSQRDVSTLHGIKMEIEVEAGGGKITSHFDEKNITDAIKKLFHISLPEKSIRFLDGKRPKHLGTYEVVVDKSSTYIQFTCEIKKAS